MNALPGDNWLFGDSGYPCSSTLLTKYPDTDTNIKRRFNQAHNRTRVLIVQVFG